MYEAKKGIVGSVTGFVIDANGPREGTSNSDLSPRGTTRLLETR